MSYYKVLKFKAGKLISHATHGVASVVYLPDVENKTLPWLAARGYHLCVFETLAQVNEYLWGTRRISIQLHLRIWEVEIGETMRLPARCTLFQLSNNKLETAFLPWPEGTVMTKSVKLVKDVTEVFIETFVK